MEQSAITNRVSPGPTPLDNLRGRYHDLLREAAHRELSPEESLEAQRLERFLLDLLRDSRREEPCPDCDGEGSIEYFRSPSCAYDHVVRCRQCQGLGTVEVEVES